MFLKKLLCIFAFYESFLGIFLLAANFSEELLPFLSVETDDSHNNENKDHSVCEDRGGGTKNVINQPKNGVYAGANASARGLFLYDADSEEPNRNAGDEIEGRAHHNERNCGKACDKYAGEPHGERLSLTVKEESDYGLYNGEDNYAADGHAVL